MLAVFVNPTIVDQADWHGIEKVQLLSPAPAREHESRRLEHFEMLHYAKARHLELRFELPKRLPVLPVKQIEQESTRLVAESPEHEVLVNHDGKLYVTF